MASAVESIPSGTNEGAGEAHEKQNPNDGQMDDAYNRYRELLTLVESRLAADDLCAAAALANVAARYAFPARVGLFGSPRLENLLLRLGRKIPTDRKSDLQCSSGHSRNVLHILSYARPIGGDSRYAWRWIQEDRESRHSVAITTQADVKGIYEIPQILKDAVSASGGFLKVLSAPTTKQLDQARELRTLCQGMDVIVLHLFPYDVIPILALATGCDSSKVVYVHHCDHTFWVGSSVCHSIIHLRTQSAQFLRERRALDPLQSSFLPTPLAQLPPPVDRIDAKRALGFNPKGILLLTIASPFKYSSPGQIGFLDLVKPILMKFPETVLVAVGPRPEGAWKDASALTNGRVVALGTRWDNNLLYSAADIYLDSVPFSSITSLLEAGSQGVALLGYKPASELSLLGPGAPGIDGVMELPADEDTYRATLARLIQDTDFRLETGRRVAANILAFHTGSKWLGGLNKIYKDVCTIKERKCLAAKDDRYQPDELNSALAELYRDSRYSMRTLIGDYIGALPYLSRVSITLHLWKTGFGLCRLNLLPPPVETFIRIVGRRLKRLMGLQRRA
jgi:hypothetical protein